MIFWQSCWPTAWKFHWTIPLYKRLSPSLPKNYRGIHLTCILGKIAERVIGQPMFDFIEKQGGYGDCQFAYRKGFSMKDLLAYVVLLWLRALDQSRKIGIYCATSQAVLTVSQAKNCFANVTEKAFAMVSLNSCRVIWLHVKLSCWLAVRPQTQLLRKTLCFKVSC